jgi:protein-tyrosine phosphatase
LEKTDDPFATLAFRPVDYAVMFGLVCAALVAGAVLHPSAAIPFGWAALSAGGVASAYAGLGPRLFGKGLGGRLPWWSKLLFLPFLGLAHLVWHLQRLTSREAPFHVVDEQLVVGRRLLASEAPNDFDHYVDLTAEFDEPAAIRSRPSYRPFPILDAGVPSAEALDRLLDLIRDGRVYIHCAQGHGRTALVAVALLAHRGRVTSVEDGLRLLRSRRPAVRLNRRQDAFVRAFLDRKSKSLARPPAPGSP